MGSAQRGVIRRKLNFSKHWRWVTVNTLAMIAGVARGGLKVAHHAKPILSEAANAVIAHNDPTAPLFPAGHT